MISIDLLFSVIAGCLNWLNNLWLTEVGRKLLDTRTHSSIYKLLSVTVDLFLPVFLYSTS